MIVGRVHGGFPWVLLELPGRDGPVEVEFVVDTGFEGELAIPHAWIAQLGFVASETQLVVMPDGIIRDCPYLELAVHWLGSLRDTEILCLKGNPLLGMQLLEGSSLYVDATEGGQVLIEP